MSEHPPPEHREQQEEEQGNENEETDTSELEESDIPRRAEGVPRREVEDRPPDRSRNVDRVES